jgi:hypothetical protein
VLAELLGHSAIIYSVAVTADGRIASGEARHVLLLSRHNSVQLVVGMLLGHSTIIYSVAATATAASRQVRHGVCYCYHDIEVCKRLPACCSVAFAARQQQQMGVHCCCDK